MKHLENLNLNLNLNIQNQHWKGPEKLNKTSRKFTFISKATLKVEVEESPIKRHLKRLEKWDIFLGKKISIEKVNFYQIIFQGGLL